MTVRQPDLTDPRIQLRIVVMALLPEIYGQAPRCTGKFADPTFPLRPGDRPETVHKLVSFAMNRLKEGA